MNDIKPGIYVLSRTVINPKPDRRCKDEWLKAEKWEEGWKFELLEDPHAEQNTGVPAYRLQCLENRHESIKGVTVYGKATGFVVGGRADDKQTDALVALICYLVPSSNPKDGFDFVFHERSSKAHEYADDILWALVKRGRITLDEVRELFHELRTDYDLPKDQFDAKWK